MELITIFCFRHYSLMVPAIRPSFKVKISFINHLSHFILNHPSHPHPPCPPSFSLTNYHLPTHFTESDERDPIRGCVHIAVNHRRRIWWGDSCIFERRAEIGVGEARRGFPSPSLPLPRLSPSSSSSSSSRRWIQFISLLYRFIGHKLSFIFYFYRLYPRP